MCARIQTNSILTFQIHENFNCFCAVASSPTDVTAVQDGPTSITVTWTPPDPLDGITGYRISFTGGSDVDIDGGSTNSYTLTGLTNGQTYTISIVATSSGLSSAPVQATVGLGMSKH